MIFISLELNIISTLLVNLVIVRYSFFKVRYTFLHQLSQNTTKKVVSQISSNSIQIIFGFRVCRVLFSPPLILNKKYMLLEESIQERITCKQLVNNKSFKSFDSPNDDDLFKKLQKPKQLPKLRYGWREMVNERLLFTILSYQVYTYQA